jgi:pyruvate/2-oxoglutarate dehydrogenase complex dihydrolipoamide dehydrogenase (E3) component
LQAEVELIRGDASFTAEGNVIVDNKHVYKAKHILIATGGRPTIPQFPGI